MKKLRKIALITVIMLVFITISLLLANRKIYGTWNVLGYPNRVSLGGYRYDNNGYIVTFTADERPEYEISRKIDRLTSKRIYSKNLDYIGNGKVVYLHLDGNRYLVLGCGGGA